MKSNASVISDKCTAIFNHVKQLIYLYTEFNRLSSISIVLKIYTRDLVGNSIKLHVAHSYYLPKVFIVKSEKV